MAFCSKCGGKLEKGALFCTSCGTSVDGTPNKPAFNPYTGYLDFQSGNVMASYGFLFSFLVPILGLVFSCIGLTRAKEFNGQGKELSIAGIVISSILIVVSIILLIVFIATR